MDEPFPGFAIGTQDSSLRDDIGGKRVDEADSLVQRSGESYMRRWAACGGDHAYLPDVMANYALCGALVWNMSWPMMVEPPEHIASNPTDPNSQAYLIALGIVNALTCGLVLVSVLVIGSYWSCIDQDTRTNFVVRFGYTDKVCHFLTGCSYILLAAAGVFSTKALLLLDHDERMIEDNVTDVDFTAVYVNVASCVGLFSLIFYYVSERNMAKPCFPTH
jgi:hypothetical protein